ncbi:MAG: biotin--[acetyl-CoA-carboxylase] ligase [Pseudomonadota bacterium]
MTIAGPDWPPGHRVVALAEVGSTNDEARARAEAGEPGPLWVRADRQVKGRGRQGRAWGEATGNLYSTLLIRPDMAPPTASLYSFIACLAVAELFEAYGCTAQLKWPNDALLNGGKAAGVLLEASGQGERLDWLAVGIGVNLAAHPEADPGALFPPTSLKASTGKIVAPDDALRHIAASVAMWGDVLKAQGFAPIREAWLARAIRLGERIEARLPDETIAGVFEDVDAEGALVLRTPTGARRIHAADIYFP